MAEKEKETKKEAPKKEEEMVEVPKSTLDSMLKDIENLKKGRVDTELDPLAEMEKTVIVRLHNDKAIVDVGQVFTKRDKDGDDVEMVEVLLDGDDKATEISYHDFIFNVPKVEAKLVKRIQEKKKEHYKQEWTTKKKVEDYHTVDTGSRVPVIVESIVETFEVELPSGNMVQLSQGAVN